nr:unnamed protein product [Trichobilharzia regenti]CAH8857213.1 unnamed protein product [Trichobilharzia regenti]
MLKGDLIKVKLISSLDLVGDEEAKLLRMPYCVCTYASQSEKHEMKSHLLLGDVIRVLYLLLTNRKHQNIALQVLRHCWIYCHRVPLADIRLFTLRGLSSRDSAHLSQYPLVNSESPPLFVVRWLSDSLLKGTLEIACSCLPRDRCWYNCCSERFLRPLSRLIFRHDAKEYILNLSKYLSSKCRQISNASSSSSASLDVLSHTPKVSSSSSSQSERRVSRDDVHDANVRLLSDRCAGVDSSVSHSSNPCSPNIIPQTRLLIAVNQTCSKNVTSMSPNTSSSLDSNSLRTTEVMNSSKSPVSVSKSTTDNSELNSLKLVTEIVVDDVPSLEGFSNPLSSGNACNNSPTEVDVACREKGSMRNSYDCEKEVNRSQCSPQPTRVCSSVVSKNSDTLTVVTNASDSCGSALQMSIDSRGESLVQSAPLSVSGTMECTHLENFSSVPNKLSDSLMLVSSRSECNESEAQSVPSNADVDIPSPLHVSINNVENMSSQPNTAEPTEDDDVNTGNPVPSSNSDGISKSPGAFTNNRDSPLKDSSCQDDHNEESIYSLENNSDEISESGSQLSSVGIVVSINRKKENSIKKVCIYLPSNTVANSPIKNIVCQCSSGEEHSDSDQVNSCTMTLDRRRVGKLKRKLKKLNHLPVSRTNTSEISEKNSTSQIESLMCLIPSTSNSFSLTKFPNGSHNLTNFRVKQPLSDLVSLPSWVQEKSLNSKAPGPVTASVLGLSAFPLSTVSVSSTSDE